jgi:Domain of Unknown Function (DUF1080)
MRTPLPHRVSRLLAATVALSLLMTATQSRAGDDEPAAAQAQRSGEGWIELIGPSGGLDAFQGKHSGWQVVGAAGLNPENPKRLVGEPGTGVVFNGPAGTAPNLVTRESFGDVELHVEFMVARNSNSGVKLEGVYEIQIFDSYGEKKATAKHSGGIYPRSELLPKYHYIDEGYAPLLNGARPAGEWQTLDISWRAPRFNDSGEKTASARFVKVLLNGRLVQDDVEVPCPTGNNWRNKEKPTGPILFQGDHGPVAFRNVRVRPLK